MKKNHKLSIEDDSLFINTFQYAPIGKALMTSTGKFIKINPSYCNFMGYTEEELLLLDYQSLTHPDDVELTFEDMKKLVSSDITHFQTEKRYIHKEGHAIWALLSCTAIPAKHGNIPIVMAQIVDINERKMMENQLKESEQRYRLTVETPINIVTRHDIEGNYLYVSPSCFEITGYEDHELLGQNFDKFIHSEDIERVKDHFKKLVESDIIQPYTYRYFKKDGTMGWNESTGRAIPDIHTGMIKEVVIVTKDITKQMELTSNLKKSQELFEVISQHSKDLITIADPNGFTRYVSPALTKLIGYESDEVLNKHTTEFWHPDDIVAVSNSDLFKSSDEGIFECRIRHKDGHYISFESSVKIVRDHHGNIERIVGIGRDITERKQAEHFMILSEKLSVASQLAAGVAHEIRNPLTAIKGFIRLLKDKIHDEAYYFGIVLSEIGRVELILNELVVLAKPKGTAWEKKKIGLILGQVAAFLRTQAILHNIEIIDLYDELELEVWVDENALKQVFVNLLKNSIEAMSNGGQIHILLNRINDDVEIRIIDQGCGIPADKLEKIGTPFYTTKENGTGLGMMISYNIIENHNGKMSIESEVNKGTTFIIRLPMSSKEIK